MSKRHHLFHRNFDNLIAILHTLKISNFEISKTIRNVVREVGEVKKLSVAVLVDGIYTEAADGSKTYTPRNQSEIDQIEELVKSAIGYDEMRGDTVEVVNMRFASIDTDTGEVIDDTI